MFSLTIQQTLNPTHSHLKHSNSVSVISPSSGRSLNTKQANYTLRLVTQISRPHFCHPVCAESQQYSVFTEILL